MIEVNEEYVIVDLVQMMSSIGGTLGICIGVSIYDFIKFCFRHFMSTLTQEQAFENEVKKKVRKRKKNFSSK